MHVRLNYWVVLTHDSRGHYRGPYYLATAPGESPAVGLNDKVTQIDEAEFRSKWNPPGFLFPYSRHHKYSQAALAAIAGARLPKGA